MESVLWNGEGGTKGGRVGGGNRDPAPQLGGGRVEGMGVRKGGDVQKGVWALRFRWRLRERGATEDGE